MLTDPTNPASNVLYNKAAMAILEDAFARLRSLGLHCGWGPDVLTLRDSEMSAVLRVSTASASLDECSAASLLVGDYIDTDEGRKRFDDTLAFCRAERAIGKAMYSSQTDDDDNTCSKQSAMPTIRIIPNPSSALLSKAVVGGAGLRLPPDIAAPPGMAMVLLYVPVEELTRRSVPEVQEDLGLPWSDGTGKPVWLDETSN